LSNLDFKESEKKLEGIRKENKKITLKIHNLKEDKKKLETRKKHNEGTIKEQKRKNEIALEGKRKAKVERDEALADKNLLQAQSKKTLEGVEYKTGLLANMKTRLVADQKTVDTEVTSALETKINNLKMTKQDAEKEYKKVEEQKKKAEEWVNALQMELQEQVKENLNSIKDHCVKNVNEIFLKCNLLTQRECVKVEFLRSIGASPVALFRIAPTSILLYTP
jgi:hypothetical protein